MIWQLEGRTFYKKYSNIAKGFIVITSNIMSFCFIKPQEKYKSFYLTPSLISGSVSDNIICQPWLHTISFNNLKFAIKLFITYADHDIIELIVAS